MVGILEPPQLAVLSNKTVAVPGAGGVGFTHAESLARMGIGRLKISDFDAFGPENIGRQFGATVHTVGQDKVEVLRDRLQSINPSMAVETYGRLTNDNIGRFLEGADLVADAIDYFAISPRRMLNAEARRRGIPVVIAGPVGYGATLHLFAPNHMSFDEYFDVADAKSEDENLLCFGMGLGPAQLYRHYMANRNLDFERKDGSVLSSACLLCTSLIGTVAMRSLLALPMFFKPVPYVYQIDLVAGATVELHIPGGVKEIKNDPEKYMR
jgi:tRNA threonylcarbamoyladenosine dehydratase